MPIHLQPAYVRLGYSAGNLPNTELVSREVLSLPLYPELNEEEVKRVCQNVIDFLSAV
jgi:dTDP-4-amino-4,6-dideoxygalactose transaminase